MNVVIVFNHLYGFQQSEFQQSEFQQSEFQQSEFQQSEFQQSEFQQTELSPLVQFLFISSKSISHLSDETSQRNTNCDNLHNCNGHLKSDAGCF